MEPLDLIQPALALVAGVTTVLVSDRLRTIVGAIFRKPKSSSVLITIGDTTLSVDNASTEEIDRLIEQFVAASRADEQNRLDSGPGEAPTAPGDDE